ncbi:MAG: electron transfer flavoprotein subunit alpha/FixB family protein, partial [Ilumatobacteraceae bacterium]
MSVLVVVEHDRGTLSPASLEALTAARALGGEVHALTLGAAADALAPTLAAFGAAAIHQVHHDLLADYGPEAWGESVAQAVRALSPDAVLACGTDRGNEVLAQAAARLDLPFVANCNEVTPGDPWTIVRVRWGGSLLEQCTLAAGTKVVSITHHSVEATESAAAGAVASLSVDLDPSLARTVVAERVERAAGVTLATSPLVVGGGRGVGSAEAFAPLEELASALGGVVG